MEQSDIWTEALSHYFTDKTWEIKSVPGGVNNLTNYIVTPNETFVMRIYQNGYGIEKIHYEHKILNKLQEINFSFKTPRIRQTLKGEDLVITSTGHQAVMFHLIPGHLPDEKILAHQREMGRVAGELLSKFKDVKVDMAPPTPPYYELYKIHPAIPDEKTFLEAVLKPEFDQTRKAVDLIVGEIVKLKDVLAPFHKSLPVQHIHGDLWVMNCLIENDKMTAVLDFEFAALDWRALEVAICVARFPSLSDPWQYFETFLEGFKTSCSLIDEEMEAIPVMMKLRLLTNIIHFTGRYVAGLDTLEDIITRMNVYEGRLGWINEHGPKVVEVFRKKLSGGEEKSK